MQLPYVKMSRVLKKLEKEKQCKHVILKMLLAIGFKFELHLCIILKRPVELGNAWA